MSVGAVDEFVGSLVELVLQFLQLLRLLWPVPSVGGSVDAVDIAMEIDQRFDRLGGQLEGNFVLGDHIDMHNVGFDMDHLIVKDGLDEGVLVFAKLSIGCLGEHHGT